MGDVISLIALLLGFSSLIIQHVKERSSKLKDQSSKISAWIELESFHTKSVFIELCNLSESPVYEVVISVVNFRTGASQRKCEFPSEFQSIIGILPPGKSYTTVKYGYRSMFFMPSIELFFKDSRNNYWMRKGNGELRKMNKSPTRHYGFIEPVGWRNTLKKIPAEAKSK